MRPPWGVHLPGSWGGLADAEAPRRTVSVVVTHYEQPAQLARTLHALTRQTLAPYDVVVADDGSATPPVVPDGVRLVRQDDRGFRAAAARNLGARHTGGEVLVFLDADTTPEPGLLETLTRLPRLQPDLLAVGRRRHAGLDGLPPEVPVEAAGPAHELPEPAWLTRGWAESHDLRDADDLSARFVISAVLACSRWWFDTLGGFEDTFDSYGGEDWELAHRSWTAGGLLAHAPDAVAWHDGPDAGVVPRGTAAHESAELAARVGVPGLTAYGLLGLHGRTVPVDRVLALDAGLGDRELVLVVDAALHADPGLRIAVDDHQGRVLGGDPRLLSRDGASALDTVLPTSARVLVELHRPRLLDPGQWRALFSPPADGAVTTVHADPGEDQAAVATTTALRVVRRARRWGVEPTGTETRDAAGSPLPEDLTLAAWWGGWAPGSPDR